MTQSLIAIAILREILEKRNPQWIIEESSRDIELESANFVLACLLNHLRELNLRKNRTEVSVPVLVPLNLIDDPWAKEYALALMRSALRENSEIPMMPPEGRADDALMIYITALYAVMKELAKGLELSEIMTLELIHKKVMINIHH